MVTNVDLTPPYVEFTVLADEPNEVHLPITLSGSPVDLAVDYPALVSRLKIGNDATIEDPIGIQDTNVAVISIPSLPRGVKIYWELRDSAADKTWLTGRINVAKDALPQ